MTNRRVNMYLQKLALQILPSMCFILLCDLIASAQVPPPRYGFVTVTNESGSPVTDAVVVIYNGSGEEIYQQLTDYGGKVFIYKERVDIIIQEQKESLNKNSKCVFRIIKTGYLTYEKALEGDLTGGVFLIDHRHPYGATGLNITLERNPNSKIGSARRRPFEDLARTRAP
jgi:hypothetical protein